MNMNIDSTVFLDQLLRIARTQEVNNLDSALSSRPVFPCGFHITKGDNWKVLEILQKIPDNSLLPIQLQSAPPRSTRYWTILPDFLASLVSSRKVRLFYHLPYVLSGWRDDKQDDALRFLEALMKYHSQNHIVGEGYVLHFSYPRILQKTEDFWEHIDKWLDSFPELNLLIENMAGSNSSETIRTGISTPLFIQKSFQDCLQSFCCPDRVGFCIDTQHAWASGVQFPKLLQSLENSKVRLVHFNGTDVPDGWGRYLDRHSQNTIRSNINSHSMWVDNSSPSMLGSDEYCLDDFLRFVQSRNIPCILERASTSLLTEDAVFLQNRILSL